ncbi:MAG: phage integrase SAM-like domain-containing protein [Muribaculum sp.]|nr:phage integrase SAM-like domain-containing protein [Muribaculum sp.]
MCSPINPIDFFRIKSEDASSKQTKDNLVASVNSLCAFIGDTSIDFKSFTDSMIGEWVSNLLFQGYTPKTISNNVLKRISTLYNKAVDEGLAEPTTVFRNFINALNEGKPESHYANCDSNIFNKVQNLIRRDYSSIPSKQLTKDIVLFSIYMGGMSFEEIANYKKGDYKGDNKAILEIVERYSKPKNKFLFPLNRFHSTPKKINKSIEVMFLDVLESNGLKLSSIPSDTSYNVWAYTAMSCGISASDVAACIAPKNKDVFVTTFAKPSELSEDKILEIRKHVETTLNYNPIHWYAMHLRPRVDFKMLSDRLKDRNVTIDEIYYPMEDVIRKVRKKKIFESQPVIAWLVFFRSRVTLLNTLFKEIGDLAWGYRHLPDYKSPYAIIPDREIRYYQQCIGTLSPSTQFLSDEQVKFNEGDYLVLLGGALNGQHAVFISEKKHKDGSDKGKVVYRVKLAGGINANWIVEHDPALVKKISESQFFELDRKYQESLK